jgi:uncharacterized protein
VRRIFVDTAHLLAILTPRDNLHDLALGVARDLAGISDLEFVTTHLIVAELLAALSGGGPHVRMPTADYVEDFVRQPNVIVVDLTVALFDRGLRLFRARADKAYSLTDCVSMEVCNDLAITEVLTSDHDFEQEGFAILLRAPA